MDLNQLYLEADEKHDNGDYEAAFRLFMQGALAGDCHAMNRIGVMYGAGQGVEKDAVKALDWHKQAWRKCKDIYLCMNIAVSYAHLGQRRRTLYWWKKAAASGDGSAMLGLAKFLLETRRAKKSQRVIELLKMAVACWEDGETMTISEAGYEEAEELLSQLTAPNRE